MIASIVYSHPYNGAQQIRVGKHSIQFGGPNGDGFCYACQSFHCIENLTQEEKDAIDRV